MTDAPAPNDRDDLREEQDFVDHAYARLDALRDHYRRAQRATHANHGVGNAQGWTERDALAAHLGDLASRLEHVEDRLVFGRLDSADGESFHIGRTALTEEDTARTLLVDWRAPAAAPFYRATPRDPLGVARRRHVTTRLRTVIALEDELLDAEAARAHGLSLQGEGALMNALSQARDGRMGDIVATIQAEQDEVIRADGSGLVVVQGGPGTGKTAVALHRAAYLLHAERERLERSGVLLLGPSRVFLRYIERVLPSLGETGVVSCTLGDLLPGITATAVDEEAVAAVKGSTAWVDIARLAVRSLQRIPEADQVLAVWNRKVTLTRDDVRRARTRARRLGTPHNAARDSFALELIDVLARRLAVESGDARDEQHVDIDDLNSWRDEVRGSIDARRAINLAWMPTSATTLLERMWARPALLAELNERAGRPFTDAQLALLERPKGSPLTVQDVPILDELEEHLGSSTALDERRAAERSRIEAEEIERARRAIESQGLGGGIVTAEMLAASARGEREVAPLAERARADRQWTYGHVVVDEAQDLSPLAWHCLLRRCPSRSFTVVGDLDQRRGHDRPATWEEALGPASRALSEEFVLSVSYRTPGEVIRRAEAIMAAVGHPVLHPSRAVRDVPGSFTVERVAPAPVGAEDGAGLGPVDGRSAAARERDADPLWAAARRAVDRAVADLDSRLGAGSGRVAVVVGAARARAWEADTSGWSGLEERVSLVAASGVKGLEFDHVIVVEPAELLADGPGDLFVALTRPTWHLHVLHARPLPGAAS